MSTEKCKATKLDIEELDRLSTFGGSDNSNVHTDSEVVVTAITASELISLISTLASAVSTISGTATAYFSCNRGCGK